MTRPSGPSSAWGLAVASLLATLLVLEAGFRVASRVHEERAFADAAAHAVPAPGSSVSLGQILRPSRHRDIVYELDPLLRVEFLDKPLSTGPSGFRGREIPAAKPAGVRRIVGIGDSIMFGWGVGDGQDYLSLLEARLASEPGPRTEVVNTAVPGYNTVMEVATLAEKGLAYSPDLVVVGLCGNDAGLPYFLRSEPDALDPGRSFLLDFVRRRLSPDDDDVDAPDLVLRPQGAGRRAVARGDTGRVPDAYRSMVGLPAFEQALRRLAALAVERHFEVLVLYYPSAPGEMSEIVERLGLPSLNTGPAVRRFLNANGGRPALARLRVSERDPHPSAEGHALIAEALYERLKTKAP